MVGVLLLIDIIILTAWEFITQPTIVKKTITEYVSIRNRDVMHIINVVIVMIEAKFKGKISYMKIIIDILFCRLVLKCELD